MIDQVQLFLVYSYAKEKNSAADLKAMQLISSPDFNAKAKTNAKLSALSYAVLFGRPKLAKVLLQKQADPNQTDSFGRTCLMNACLTQQPEICALLLDHGCQQNVRNRQQRTALDLAIDK